MRDSIFFKSFCITFAVLMFMACGGGGGGGGGGGDNSSPNIALSESNYDFSGVVNNNSADHTFEITNAGNANLSIGQISGLAAPYSVPAPSDACSNKTLGPSDSCTFRARFEPTVEGVFADQISIPSNDPSGTATIGLLGEGYGLNVWIKNATADQATCDVTIDVTVTQSDAACTPVETLVKDNFTILVDGNPAIITNNAPYIAPSAVSVVLAIDWSGSEEDVIDEIRTAAKDFIGQLNDSDEIKVCKFNNVTDYDPATFYDVSTQSAADAPVKLYIDGDFAFGSQTYLYDAMYESITKAALGTKPKQVVVVMSDGVDTGSPNHTLTEVIDYSVQQNIPVFTIYYRDPTYGGGDYGDPDILRQAADGSDGQDYDGMTGGLSEVYGKIANVISNKYVIEINVAPCVLGNTISLDVAAEDAGSHGEDSTTVTFQ